MGLQGGTCFCSADGDYPGDMSSAAEATCGYDTGGAGGTATTVAIYSLQYYDSRDPTPWGVNSRFSVPADLDNDATCDALDDDDDEDGTVDADDAFPRVQYATADTCFMLDYTTDDPATGAVG